MTAAVVDDDTLQWLLEGDPAVRWRAERDLLGRAPRTYNATRRRIAHEGWGARLLAHQDDDGRWAQSWYSPKWTSTFYSVRLLSLLGLPASNANGILATRLLLERGVTDGGGVRLWQVDLKDVCVTAMLLSLACHFDVDDDERTERMLGFLLSEQMADGGWNCDRHAGATHASFHSSMATLEALLAFRRRHPSHALVVDARAAEERGRAFFLEHQLYRSSTTGAVVRPAFSQLSFPPRWHFDVLRGLLYFAEAGAPVDPRLQDALDVVRRKRRRDGRWTAQNHHSGREWFRLEPGRFPSRMNTLRALRVLQWADDDVDVDPR